MEFLNLPYPHGFLVWQRKQKAIASNELLDSDRYLIITDNNSFGVVKLGQPSAMTLETFDREIDNHYVRPFQRRLWWPDAKKLYSYPIVNFKKHKKPLAFIDGKEIDYKPRGKELQIILKAKELPSRIVLDEKAVSVGATGFDLSEIIKESPTLRRLLKAYYECEIDDIQGNLSLPIYQLALIRNPNMIVEKR